jgi:hypothetical protein
MQYEKRKEGPNLRMQHHQCSQSGKTHEKGSNGGEDRQTDLSNSQRLY